PARRPGRLGPAIPGRRLPHAAAGHRGRGPQRADASGAGGAQGGILTSKTVAGRLTTIGVLRPIRPSLARGVPLADLVSDAIPIGPRHGGRRSRIQPFDEQSINSFALGLPLLDFADNGPHVFAHGAETLLGSLRLDELLHRIR